MQRLFFKRHQAHRYRGTDAGQMWQDRWYKSLDYNVEHDNYKLIILYTKVAKSSSLKLSLQEKNYDYR